MPALGSAVAAGRPCPKVRSRGGGRCDGPALSLRSVAHLPFWATNVDTNTDRVATFLAAHPGQFYCNGCLSVEVPVRRPIQVNQLTRALHGVKPYRSGRAVCVSCGEVRECIPYGLSDLAGHEHSRVDHLSLPEARRLGATARQRGRPIYGNPYRGRYAKAWREGWKGASSAVGGSRSSLQPGSFGAELYDYLVRHDRDDGLTVHEITEGFVDRDSATVTNGLYNLCRRRLVRRLLPTMVGQRRTPQRYRAVPRPPRDS